MECSECGAEIQRGSFYCGSCGRPAGVGAGRAAGGAEPGLDDLPPPRGSREAPPTASRREGYFICHLCLGAFPDGRATEIEGNPYCGDCAPVESRRIEAEAGSPDPTPARAPADPQWAPRPAGATPVLRKPGPPAVSKRGRAIVASLLLAVAVVVAVGFPSLGSGGRIAALLRGVDRGRDEARLMVVRYAPGKRFDYRVTGGMKLEGEASGFPGGAQDLAVEATLEGRMSVTVLDTESCGNADVEIAFEDFRTELTSDAGGAGPEMLDQMSLFPLNGAVFRTRLDAFGEPLEPLRRVDGGSGGGGMEELVFGGAGKVPHRELAAGDTWTATETEQLPGPGPGVLTMNARYEMIGYKELLGRDCMVVTMDADFVPEASGMPPGMEMAMSGRGVLFFDPHAGVMVKNAIDVRADLAMSGPQGTATFRLEMTMDVDLR